MDAIVNDDLESLRILIAHGADVNHVSKYHETPLSMTVRRAHPQFADPASMVPYIRQYKHIASELLARGADPNFKDFSGLTILQTAEKYHEDDVVKELKARGAKE
jgi:ankyrin repeat protein